MDSTQQFLFGDGNLDAYSLTRVRALHVTAGLECRRCHKFAALDVDELEHHHRAKTLGEVRRRARCGRRGCGATDPVILLCSLAMRGDRAWFPRPPGLTR